MVKLKGCGCDIFYNENHLGKPLEYKICMHCWESMAIDQRKAHIKNGVVPITVGLTTAYWQKFCKRYNFKKEKS